MDTWLRVPTKWTSPEAACSNNSDLAREGLDSGEVLGADGLQLAGTGDVAVASEQRSLEQVAARGLAE